MSSIEQNLEQEIRLIVRALRPEQFRLIVVQYNHALALERLTTQLSATYPDRKTFSLDGRKDSVEDILTFLHDPEAGIIYLHHLEELLNDTAFTQSLNQRRDALSGFDVGLILLLPVGGDYMKKLSRTMPDLWSLRNLVSELTWVSDTGAGGSFMTNDGKEYHRLENQDEIRQEIESLQKRIEEVSEIPGSRNLLSTLYNRLGKLQMALSKFSEARDAFEKSMDISSAVGDSQSQAEAMTELGEVLIHLGEYDDASDILENSLKIQREIGDKGGEAVTLNNISQILYLRGSLQIALSRLEEALEIQHIIGDKSGEGTTLNNISQIFRDWGDYSRGLSYLEEALTIAIEIGDQVMEGTILNNISQIYQGRGEYQKAFTYLQKSLEIGRNIGNKSGESTALHNMSHVFEAQEDYQTALHFLNLSLSTAREIKDSYGEAITRVSIGRINWQQEKKADEAVPMLSIAHTIFRRIGSPEEDAAAYYLNEIKQEIGEERFREILQSHPELPQDLI